VVRQPVLRVGLIPILFVGSSHIEGGLNMGLLFQALSKTRNLSLTTSVAHSNTVLSYYLSTLTKVSLANITLGGRKQPRQDKKHTSERQEQR
jgi:hypothetical protein